MISAMPNIMHVFCSSQSIQHQNYWTLLGAIKKRISQHFSHQNQGVRILAVRFMQTIIRIQSVSPIDPISINLVPLDHPYLQKAELQIECTAFVNQFNYFLSHTDQFMPSPSFISAVLNSTFEILKSRPQFGYQCIEAFLKCAKNPRTPNSSSLDVRMLQKNLKVVLLSCFA